jgi:hypothetical protein
MARFSAAIAALFCCCAAAPAARADQAFYAFSFSVTPSVGGTGTELLPMPRFDPSLYHGAPLLSVEIEATIGIASPSLGEAASFSGSSFTATLGADLSVSFATLTAAATPSVSRAFSGPGTLSGPTWTAFGATITTGLSPFVGTGLFEWTLSDTPFASATNGASANLTGAGTWAGTLSMTYTYQAAPEPGSWVMMGMGAVGIGWIGRRRRRDGNPG